MPLTYLKGEGGDKLKVRDIDGAYTFPWNSLENHEEEFRSIPNWKARDDDVMICVYPKSGTHWAYEILSMLLSQKAERVETFKQSGMLDFISQEQFNSMPSPRVLNTHSLFSQLPVDFRNRKCKIVHIIRNPKDVAVSFFHHHVGLKPYEFDGNWESYLPRFMKGDVDYNSWFDYTNDWEKTIIDNPDYPIHIMYYEDMVENIHAEIFKLANFLEVCTHSTLDFINSVASLCTIDKMRKEKASTAAFYWKEDSAGVYRKGIVGDWKSMFTVTQNEIFDELYYTRMNKSKLNIRFSIPEKLPAKSQSVFH